MTIFEFAGFLLLVSLLYNVQVVMRLRWQVMLERGIAIRDLARERSLVAIAWLIPIAVAAEATYVWSDYFASLRSGPAYGVWFFWGCLIGWPSFLLGLGAKWATANFLKLRRRAP